MTTDNPAAQPAGVEGVPERLYAQLLRDGSVAAYERDPREVHDNGKPVYVYTRTSPTEIAERARQVALQLKHDADDMFAMPVDDEPLVSQWAAIITAEFGGGRGGENKSEKAIDSLL